jgi:hypothetical protein
MENDEGDLSKDSPDDKLIWLLQICTYLFRKYYIYADGDVILYMCTSDTFIAKCMSDKLQKSS